MKKEEDDNKDKDKGKLDVIKEKKEGGKANEDSTSEGDK